MDNAIAQQGVLSSGGTAALTLLSLSWASELELEDFLKILPTVSTFALDSYKLGQFTSSLLKDNTNLAIQGQIPRILSAATSSATASYPKEGIPGSL
jgi:hypothetical protein